MAHFGVDFDSLLKFRPSFVTFRHFWGSTRHSTGDYMSHLTDMKNMKMTPFLTLFGPPSRTPKMTPFWVTFWPPFLTPFGPFSPIFATYFWRQGYPKKCHFWVTFWSFLNRPLKKLFWGPHFDTLLDFFALLWFWTLPHLIFLTDFWDTFHKWKVQKKPSNCKMSKPTPYSKSWFYGFFSWFHVRQMWIWVPCRMTGQPWKMTFLAIFAKNVILAEFWILTPIFHVFMSVRCGFESPVEWRIDPQKWRF